MEDLNALLFHNHEYHLPFLVPLLSPRAPTTIVDALTWKRSRHRRPRHISRPRRLLLAALRLLHEPPNPRAILFTAAQAAERRKTAYERRATRMPSRGARKPVHIDRLAFGHRYHVRARWEVIGVGLEFP